MLKSLCPCQHFHCFSLDWFKWIRCTPGHGLGFCLIPRKSGCTYPETFMINGLTYLPKVNVNCWEVCFRNPVLTRAKITKAGHLEQPSGPQCCGHFLDTQQLVKRCMNANQTEIKQVEKGILPLTKKS